MKTIYVIAILVLLVGCSSTVPREEDLFDKNINQKMDALERVHLCEELAKTELGFIKPDCTYTVIYSGDDCDCVELATGIECIEHVETEHTKRCVDYSQRTIEKRNEVFEIKTT